MSVPDRASSQPPGAIGPGDAASGTSDVLTALRASTRTIHDRLDASLPLSHEHAGLNDYALHLVAIEGWLHQLTPVLSWPGAPATWPARHAARLERVRADLHDCSDLPTENDIPADAALPAPLGTPDPAAAWGAAYVVEGSQLGGLMLYRRLQASLAPHPLRYLAGDGERGGWPAFIAELRSAVVTPADVHVACAAAQASFDLLVQRFERLGALA